MKKGFSEILCVIDESGSMGVLRNEAIGGFNTFLEDQKKVKGAANLTMATFNSAGSYRVVYDNVDIQNVKPLNTENYRPGGMTALYDAVAQTMKTAGDRLANTPEKEKPEYVIVAIVTDGDENNSKEHTHAQIAEMIKHQTDKYSWKFVFLAAGMDAKEVATGLNIGSQNAFQFDATPKGVATSYEGMTRATTNYRAGASNAFDDIPDMKVTMENKTDNDNADI